MAPETDFIIVLTTFPAEGDVAVLAETLVGEKLAACVNVLPPMQSIYSWKGVIEKAAEHQLVIKTTRARRDELKTRLKSLHPYETPEFIVVPIIDGSADYLSWLRAGTE